MALRSTACALVTALAACALVTALAACAADPAGPDPTTRSIAPGVLIEGVLVGGPTDDAVIRLSASRADLDWNLHGHDGDAVQVLHEELGVADADYLFVPPAQGEWWLLLRNRGTSTLDVHVDVEVHGAMTWAWR